MANEAIIIELLGNGGDPVNYTIADATAVPKGTIMELTSARTCVIASGAGVVIAGIAASEKVTGDGSTTIPLYTNGIFELITDVGKTATLGSYVRNSAAGTNEVELATTLDRETGKAVGKCLTTDAAGGVLIQVKVDL